MSVEKILEKVDAIEAQQVSKIEEAKAEVTAKVEEAKAEMAEKLVAIEAKLSEVQAPAQIKVYKSLTEELNRSVKEQMKEFVKSDARVEKELKIFADEAQYQAFRAEASALTGSGLNVGGRVAYDPVFVSLRQTNPLRGVSRSVATDGSAYTFRSKTGNAGATWGYPIANNTSATTESTVIWQLPLQDLNTQFPIRTSALDDIDGLEGNVISDMLAEFGQVEGQSMILNNDQTDTPNTYGGTQGLRGLNQYGGSNSVYAGGTASVASYGSSGTGSTAGLHNLATYDQITTNGSSATVNNVTYKDIVNFIYTLPNQYWTDSAKFLINPIMLQAVRGLTDDQGRPIYIDGLARQDGIVGQLLGFDVVVNKYVDTPNYAGVNKANLFPIYFGDWTKGHAIVDRLNMILRRYDQTQPGYINFFGEKRLCSSVVDPLAIVRYRSTATAND